MTDASSKTRRRWFQFSLRTLLIVGTLVAGLLVAWRVYVEPYRRQRETMAYIKEVGGEYKTEPGGPSWLRGLFGDDDFQNIIEISLSGKGVSDANLAHFKGLTNLQSLNLANTQVSDAGIQELQKALPNCAFYPPPGPYYAPP